MGPIECARVRHYESMLDPSQRLYWDPYAKPLYDDSSINEFLVGTFSKSPIGGEVPGYIEMVSARTKWIDDAVMEFTNQQRAEANDHQLVILRCGFDTRSIRLPLSHLCHVFEIDKTETLQQKMDTLAEIAQKGDMHVQGRFASKQITFVTASKRGGLAAIKKYSQEKPTMVLMEDVTQYVSKETTAEQLRKIADITPDGSTVLLTYANKDCFEKPQNVGPSGFVKNVMTQSKEPWITGFTEEEMRTFLKKHGFDVIWDVSAAECQEEYFKDKATRKMHPSQMLNMERFVAAKRVELSKFW